MSVILTMVVMIDSCTSIYRHIILAAVCGNAVFDWPSVFVYCCTDRLDAVRILPNGRYQAIIQLSLNGSLRWIGQAELIGNGTIRSKRRIFNWFGINKQLRIRMLIGLLCGWSICQGC